MTRRFITVPSSPGLTGRLGGNSCDLIILSGIMGNICAADIERLVHVSRRFCAPAATIIWTRGAQEPDLGPDIRRWFSLAGFEELSCQEWIEGTGMRAKQGRVVA